MPANRDVPAQPQRQRRSCSQDHQFEEGATHQCTVSSTRRYLAPGERKGTHFRLYRSPSLVYLSAMSGCSSACCSMYSIINPVRGLPLFAGRSNQTPTALARSSTRRSFFHELSKQQYTAVSPTSVYHRFLCFRNILFARSPSPIQLLCVLGPG